MHFDHHQVIVDSLNDRVVASIEGMVFVANLVGEIGEPKEMQVQVSLVFQNNAPSKINMVVQNFLIELEVETVRAPFVQVMVMQDVLVTLVLLFEP